jgi:DNA repair protein RadC
LSAGVGQIKLLPPLDRPRERLLSAGTRALGDVELVSILFGGNLECAAAVVRAMGSVRGLARAGLVELCEVPGVGEARACQLHAALELGRRALVEPVARGEIIRTPAQVVALCTDLMMLEEEELHVLALDARHRMITRFLAARGALNAVHVAPRDLLRRLVRESAAAMILAHNHPSGDPEPSPEDIELTRRLHASGQLLGVPLLDHLVITRDGFYSFADQLSTLG